MKLAHPWLLLAIVLLPLYWHQRGRIIRRSAIPFAPLQFQPAPARSRNARRLGLVLEVLILGVGLLVLAGPHLENQHQTLSEEGLDLALVLDISASMQAADFQPNRLEVLKRLSAELIESSAGNRVGVFVFAKHVFTQTPLTSDLEGLSMLIESLAFETINHVRSGGTAIGDALLMAIDSLARHRTVGRDQMIVLFTDGESTNGSDPMLAARALHDSEVRLQIVGIGEKNPVPVYVNGKPFITVQDKILETRLDDRQLRAIASTAGGTYQHAGNAAVLEQIFEQLAELTRAPLEIETVLLRQTLAPALSGALAPLFAGWLILTTLQLRRPLR